MCSFLFFFKGEEEEMMSLFFFLLIDCYVGSSFLCEGFL